MRLAVALLLAGAVGAAASAQPVVHAHGPGGICTLYDRGGIAEPGPALALPDADVQARVAGTSKTVVTQAGTAVFAVTYSGFTPEAEAAFQRAVDIWAVHLSSPVTVRVSATFGDLGESVLGSAGPRLTRDWGTNVPRRNTWYPFALADALAGEDLFPPDDEGENHDITARFNSEFDRFYFGTDAVPTNKYDFTTVVLHEIGHGLGFVGSGDVDDGVVDVDTNNAQECGGVAERGCWGYFNGQFFGYPLIFDRYIEAGDGTAFLNQAAYPNNSVALGDLLQSEDLFVDAPTVRAVYGGERPPIWAPAAFEGGSSFSHWDEIFFVAGTSSALMTPQISPGERYIDPGTITCAFFQDMGWSLGNGCSAIVASEPDAQVADRAFALVASSGDYGTVGPNPFQARSVVRLVVATPQTVEVDLVDALGRRVSTVFSGVVEAGATPLVVDGARLAPGVYVVRARGETAVATATLTHVE